MGQIFEITNWWGSTEYYDDYATIRFIHNIDDGLISFTYNKEFGFSVRCVKD
jgi:uncharacterized protein (TIGR02145 family)